MRLHCIENLISFFIYTSHFLLLANDLPQENGASFFFINLPFFCLSPGAIIDFLMNALSVSACVFVQRLHLFSLSLFMCNESAESLFAFCYALVFFITIENHSGETISSKLDVHSPLVSIFISMMIFVCHQFRLCLSKRFIEEIDWIVLDLPSPLVSIFISMMIFVFINSDCVYQNVS